MTTALSGKAMLSALQISQWTAKKLDKPATRQVNADNKAHANAARVNKKLITDTALSDIQTHASLVRDYHYSRTLPWLDNGARILPALVYAEYRQTMKDHEYRFADLVRTFVAVYPEARDNAREQLGGLFRVGDYPDTKDIAARFRFNVRLVPMPEAEDFRVDIGDAEKARVQAQMQADMHDTLMATQRNVFEQIAETVGNMADKLSKDASATRLHPSLVGYVVDLVNMIPAFNFADDARLTSLCDAMRSKLAVYDIEALKDDKALRKVVADDATAILEQVNAYMA